ncbi:hypothetical protein KAI87_06905, partial [Myxococcota bacterium]|nr:hypothetical protein [Myxococcota bacterium]
MRLSFSIFLAALPLILSACFVDVPDPHDGVFACQSDEDCANDFYCEYSRTENPNDGLCMPHGNDDANTGDGTCDDICPFPETCVEGACVFDESACVPANVPVNSNFGWCPYDLPCFDGICVANEPGCGQDGDPLQCEYEGQACKQEGWCWGDDGSGNAVYCSLDGEVDHQKCQTLIDKDSFCAAYPTCIDTDECNGCGFPYLCDATIDPPTCTYDNTIFCWANNPQGKCPPDSYCIGGACYINNTECESGTIEGDTCTDSTSVCQPVGRCTDEYNQTCYPYSDEGHFSCRSENDITSNYCAVYLECVSPDGCATHEDCITNNAGNICMDAKCKWTCYSGGDYCPPNYSCEDTLDNKTRCVHNNNECSPQNNTCDGQSCFWNSVCVDPWGNMGEPCAPDYNCPNNQNCVPNYSCRDMSCFTYNYPTQTGAFDDHCA